MFPNFITGVTIPYKDWGLEKVTKVYPRFLIEKRSEFFFPFLLPPFSLITWVMTSPKNFEKIVILKT